MYFQGSLIAERHFITFRLKKICWYLIWETQRCLVITASYLLSKSSYSTLPDRADTIMFIFTYYMTHECMNVNVFLYQLYLICLHFNVRPCAGFGASESSQSCQRSAGLRQGLSELHLRVHLQQLSGALQPPVSARRPSSELLSKDMFWASTVDTLEKSEISAWIILDILAWDFLSYKGNLIM